MLFTTMSISYTYFLGVCSSFVMKLYFSLSIKKVHVDNHDDSHSGCYGDDDDTGLLLASVLKKADFSLSFWISKCILFYYNRIHSSGSILYSGESCEIGKNVKHLL